MVESALTSSDPPDASSAAVGMRSFVSMGFFDFGGGGMTGGLRLIGAPGGFGA